ncbi:MAG: hypothetical protein ABIY50_06440 [Ignavibacteria bacterium]
MKTFYLSFILLLFILASGCSNDTPVGPGANVTFTIAGQGDPNSYTFGFQPSVDIRLTQIISALPSQGFFDTLPNQTPAYVFSKDTLYTLDPFVGVQQGQAWTFSFTGSTVANNAAFTNTTNYTVP